MTRPPHVEAVPPATFGQLAAQPGRRVGDRIVVTDPPHNGGGWEAFWLPATGELLAVVGTHTDRDDWAVVRLACNIDRDQAERLAANPPGSVAELIERLARTDSDRTDDVMAGSGWSGWVAR